MWCAFYTVTGSAKYCFTYGLHYFETSLLYSCCLPQQVLQAAVSGFLMSVHQFSSVFGMWLTPNISQKYTAHRADVFYVASTSTLTVSGGSRREDDGYASPTVCLWKIPPVKTKVKKQLQIWYFLKILYCTLFDMPSLLWRCWFGWQEGHPACKKTVVGCRCGCLSGTRCRLAYGLADATATHCLLLQIRFTFLVPAHLGSPGKSAVKWTLCVCALCLDSKSDFWL